eukprot:3610595-Prymnesium_polylepis.1
MRSAKKLTVLTPSPVGSRPRVRRNRPHVRETGRMRGNRIWVVRDGGRVSRASSRLASKAHGLEPSPSETHTSQRCIPATNGHDARARPGFRAACSQ